MPRLGGPAVVFECDDPYELASFWSQVTGYQEDPDDPNRPGDRAALLIAPDGSPDLLFIQVDEATDVVRLTLAVADLEGEIERMRGLGATITYGTDEDVVFSDPEGNEFRLVVGRPRKPALPRLALDAPVRVRVRSRDDSVLNVDIPAGVLRGLQALGDAVLAALSQGDEGARRVAPPLIAALREREWEGDDLLAGQLETMLATGAIPDLQPAPVKLDQVADALEGDPMWGDGRLNLETGDVWPSDTDGTWGSAEAEEEGAEDKWLYIHCEGSREGYRDMEVFIATMRNAVPANHLELAIRGRGAFRRFRETIQEWPGERERWDEFSAERQLGRARAWLDGSGYYVRIGVLDSDSNQPSLCHKFIHNDAWMLNRARAATAEAFITSCR